MGSMTAMCLNDNRNLVFVSMAAQHATTKPGHMFGATTSRDQLQTMSALENLTIL